MQLHDNLESSLVYLSSLQHLHVLRNKVPVGGGALVNLKAAWTETRELGLG